MVVVAVECGFGVTPGFEAVAGVALQLQLQLGGN